MLGYLMTQLYLMQSRLRSIWFYLTPHSCVDCGKTIWRTMSRGCAGCIAAHDAEVQHEMLVHQWFRCLDAPKPYPGLHADINGTLFVYERERDSQLNFGDGIEGMVFIVEEVWPEEQFVEDGQPIINHGVWMFNYDRDRYEQFDLGELEHAGWTGPEALAWFDCIETVQF